MAVLAGLIKSAPRWSNTNATTQKIDKELAYFSDDIIERVRSIEYAIGDKLSYELQYGSGKSVLVVIKKLKDSLLPEDTEFYKELLSHAVALSRSGF